MGALYFNNDKEYSDLQVLVNGSSYMNRQSGTGERWGDYLGIQSKFNNPGTVYTTGYYSLEFNNNSTWVSEIFSPDTTARFGMPPERLPADKARVMLIEAITRNHGRRMVRKKSSRSFQT